MVATVCGAASSVLPHPLAQTADNVPWWPGKHGPRESCICSKAALPLRDSLTQSATGRGRPTAHGLSHPLLFPPGNSANAPSCRYGPHRLDDVIARDEIDVVQVDSRAAVGRHNLDETPSTQRLPALALEGPMLFR